MSEAIYIQIDGEKIEAKGAVLDQLLADKAEFEAEDVARQALAAKKQAAKAKLEALGLDADDLKALGL